MTAAQKRVFDVVKKFIDRHGYSPSYEEIAKDAHLLSLASVHRHLSRLKEAGWLDFERGSSRSVRLSPNKIYGFKFCDKGHEPIYFAEKKPCPMCSMIGAYVRGVTQGEINETVAGEAGICTKPTS